MKETFTISIHKAIVGRLLYGHVTIEQYLEENSREITGFLPDRLIEYHLGDGGSVSIFEPEIDFEDNLPYFDYAALKGKIFIDYQVEHYYGCDDINKVQSHTMTWNFSIDKKDCTITFEGQDKWEMDN